MFACRYLDDGTDEAYSLGHLQVAKANRGYWISNMLQTCYTGVHAAVYVPVALAVLGSLSMGERQGPWVKAHVCSYCIPAALLMLA